MANKSKKQKSVGSRIIDNTMKVIGWCYGKNGEIKKVYAPMIARVK